MVAPHKCESPVAAGLIAEQSSQDTAIVGGGAVDHKRLATLKAQIALRGFAVHDTASAGWLVARWDRSHYCRDISDLEAFLRRVGGADGAT